ncbi:MAG: hypothetical protein AAF702_32015 [Chloroflexota bacterium]
MLKDKFWYVLSGVLIAFLAIGLALYSLAPALADDIFIPFTTGTDRVESESVESELVELDSIEADSTDSELAVNSSDAAENLSRDAPTSENLHPGYPAPDEQVAGATATPIPEGYVRLSEISPIATEFMDELGDVWVNPDHMVFIGETTPDPAPTMDLAEFQRQDEEMRRNAPPAEIIYVSGPETAGSTIDVNGQEITLPSDTYVAAYIVSGTCIPIPDDPHHCGAYPVYHLRQGEDRVFVEKSTGKIRYSGRQSTEQRQRSQEAFRWLEEQLPDSTVVVIHRRKKSDVIRLGRNGNE